MRPQTRTWQPVTTGKLLQQPYGPGGDSFPPVVSVDKIPDLANVLSVLVHLQINAAHYDTVVQDRKSVLQVSLSSVCSLANESSFLLQAPGLGRKRDEIRMGTDFHITSCVAQPLIPDGQAFHRFCPRINLRLFGSSDYHRSRASHLFYSKKPPSFAWFEREVRDKLESVKVGRFSVGTGATN